METYIENLKEDPFNYANNLSEKELEDLIKYSADKYFNSEDSVISDSLYDLLIDFLKVKNPNNKILKLVGSSVNSGNKVKLPYTLYSMDKIKPPSKELDKWIETFNPPYYLSDKLDGISALLVYYKDDKIGLFTRGDSSQGRDVSFLLKYLSNIPTPDKIKEYIQDNDIKGTTHLMAFRGELVIEKELFQNKYSTKFKNERAMVSGVVNSKKLDPMTAKDISFVTYEVVDPFVKIKKQYKIIKRVGLKRVEYEKMDIISFDYLSEYFKDRRIKSKYLIDGIIVTNNDKHKRTIKTNPKYAFAFKDVLEDQMSEATVLDIEWNASKDGYLNPTVIIEPIKLGGVTIKRVTAYNAKYIKDNKIGKGTILKIIRSGDVIPKIIEIIKEADEPLFPDLDFVWNSTKVDILVKNQKENKDILVKELVFFFKKMDIANLGEGTIKKFVNNGLDSIPKIIKASIENFMEIDSIKEKSATKIYNNIHNRLKNTDIALLMAASNQFGHGFGFERAKLIIDEYPNILINYDKIEKDVLIEKIKLIQGFDTITAEQFIDGIDKFKTFYNKIKDFIVIKENEIIEQNGFKFNDEIVVFTGFRDKNLEESIIKEGGKIGKTISSKTTLVVCKDQSIKDGSNSKIKLAKEKDIKVVTKDEIIKMLN